jgi:hypothetical protein
MGQAVSKAFTFTSGGAAYNLIVGFQPNLVRIVNVTKFATDNTNVEFLWDDSMAAGYAYARKTGDGEVNSEIITSNGVSAYSTAAMTDISEAMSAATQANPCVITVGSTANWTAGDYVRIRDVVGMTELNENLYKILAVPSSTTASLDVDSSGFTAYTSGGNAYNQSQLVQASGGHGVTLGTSVVGADGDVLKVYCYLFDQDITDLGDIG